MKRFAVEPENDFQSAGAPFRPRGPLSAQLMAALAMPPFRGEATLEHFRADLDRALAITADIVRDEDVQLTLLLLYGLSYGDVIDADEDWEWNTTTIAARRAIEGDFERRLRECLPVVPLPSADAASVAALLFELTAPESGPSVARYIAKQATVEQLREFVVQRSIYTLKEADPHSWAIPRLFGRAKAALVEIQADEYGGGRPERMHSTIFAHTMRGLGLDPRYGRYVDLVPAITLASFNMMSMFGLNRRLRGAIAGHLAAFEMTSSLPNRLIGNGFRRHGFGADTTWYFDEHVEADAVHEQIAGRDLAGALAEDEPALLPDILFGARACLLVDGWAGDHILDSWAAGRSSLLQPLARL